MEEDIKFTTTTPSMVLGLEKILNYLKDNPDYIAKFNNTKIAYVKTIDNKDRFVIERENVTIEWGVDYETRTSNWNNKKTHWYR